MSPRDPSSPAATAPALAPSLAVLRQGGDAGAHALEQALRAFGADLAIWTAPGGRGLRWARRTRADRIASGDGRNAPRELPWELLVGARPRLRAAAPLERCGAAGGHALLVARAGAARLCLVSRAPIAPGEAACLELLRALEQLHELQAAWRDVARSARLAELGAGAAGAAHDLRHRLTLAALELEHAGGAAPALVRELAPLRRLLADAHAACGALLGEPTCDPRPVPLRRLLEREARAALRLVGEERAADLRLRCPRALTFEGPAVALERLARNLVLNALHATPRGGSVRVAASRGPEGETLLEVADEGRGMSARELERAMQPGVSGGAGSGFGTESVRRCVERLGGRLELRSARGAGTRARVLIPSPAAPARHAPSPVG